MVNTRQLLRNELWSRINKGQYGRQCHIRCMHTAFMHWIAPWTYCRVIALLRTLHGGLLHSNSSLVLPPPHWTDLIRKSSIDGTQYSLTKWYVIILRYQVYRFMLYMFWTPIEPITTQTYEHWCIATAAWTSYYYMTSSLCRQIGARRSKPTGPNINNAQHFLFPNPNRPQSNKIQQGEVKKMR